MKGLWRPAVTYGVILVAVLLLKGGLQVPAPVVMLFVLVSTAVLGGVVTAMLAIPPGRFLKGLHDAGLPIEVLEDEVGWFGNRRIRARSLQGEWLIESEGSAKSRSLHVRAPGMRKRVEVRGNTRRTAREAALALGRGEDLAATLAPEARSTGPVAPAWLRTGIGRRALQGFLVLVGPAVALLAAWSLRVGALSRDGASVLLWTGLGFWGFVATVGGFSWAWRRWEPRAEVMGKRWGSAVLLVGTGAGVAAVTLLWTVAAYVGSLPVGDWIVPGGTFSLAAASLAVLSLHAAGAPTRLLLTGGAFLVGAAGFHLPSRFIGLVVGGLAFGSLVLAWVSNDPEPGEG